MWHWSSKFGSLSVPALPEMKICENFLVKANSSCQPLYLTGKSKTDKRSMIVICIEGCHGM